MVNFLPLTEAEEKKTVETVGSNNYEADKVLIFANINQTMVNIFQLKISYKKTLSRLDFSQQFWFRRFHDVP